MLNSGQTVAGVTVPDTKLARTATELIRDRTSDLVCGFTPIRVTTSW